MNKDALRTGQLDLLLLAVLARGPAHGYALMEELRRRSQAAFDFPEGTVYPALYRLERGGLLRSHAKEVAGRRRRVYQLTASGRAALAERGKAWKRLVADVERVLKGAPKHAPA